VLRIGHDKKVHARFSFAIGKSSDQATELFQRIKLIAQEDGGVVIIDPAKQGVMRLRPDGSMAWQQALCPQGPAPDCNAQAAAGGYLYAFNAVAEVGDGRWFASDGQTVFKHVPGKAPQWIAGRRLACDRTVVAGTERFAPCFDDRYVAVALGEQRFLWASRYDEQRYIFEMQLVAQGGTTVARFSPAPYTAQTMPDEVRIAMFDLLNRHTGYRLFSDQIQGKGRAITADGFVLTPSQMVTGEHPLRFVHDVDWARLGSDRILLTDRRKEQMWVYDLRKRTLSPKPVEPKLVSNQMIVDPRLRHGFGTWMGNDPSGRALLVDTMEGVLREITPDLRMLPIAKLPNHSIDPNRCGGHTHPVQAVAQDSTGRWWLSTQVGALFVQHKNDFVALGTGQAWGTGIGALPTTFGQIYQLIPGYGGEMIIVASDGVAKVRVKVEGESAAGPDSTGGRCFRTGAAPHRPAVK
jgi:hypothetical protein